MATPTLGIKVDTSDVAKGVLDLDAVVPAAQRATRAATDLAGGVTAAAQKTGAAASQIRAGVEQAAQSVQKASSGIETSAMAMAQATAASAMQMRNNLSQMAADAQNLSRRINDALNIKAPVVDLGRAADIQAYGRSLDQLRARFNPLYAEISRYREQMAAIRQANAVGAISADEMTAALGRQRQEALASIAAIKARNQALAAPSATQSLGRSARPANDNSASYLGVGVGYQLQDTIVSAPYASPLMVGLQQGTQLGATLTQALGEQGAGGAVKALGSGLLSLVSPINLAAIAGTALLAWGIKYISTMQQVRGLDEILKDHEKNISALNDLWGNAGKGVEAYAKQSRAALTADARLSESELRASLNLNARSALPDLGTNTSFNARARVSAQNRSLMGGDFAVNPQFSAFSAQILKFQQTVKAGTPDVIAFRDAIAAVYNSQQHSDALDKAYRSLRDLTDEAYKASLALPQVDKALAQNQQALAAAARQADNYAKSLDALKGFGARMSEDAQIQQAYNQARAAAQDKGERDDAERFRNAAVKRRQQERDDLAAQRAADIAQINARTDAERLAAARQAAEAIREPNEDDTDQGRADRAARIESAVAEKRAQINKEAADAARERSASLQKTIADAQQDLALVGQTSAATAALRLQYQLIAQVREEAAKRNVKANEDEIALIKQQTAEYGRLLDAAAKAKLYDDLQFERDQLARSDQDAAIASRLKAAGQPIDFNSPTAEQIKYNLEVEKSKQLWEDIRKTGMDAVDSITQSASNGFKDWKSTLKGIEGDIVKQFTQLGSNQIKNSIFGTNLPTLDTAGGVTGFFGTLLGLKDNPAKDAAKVPIPSAVSGMTITAMGAININGGLGGVASGLLPPLGGSSAAGATAAIAGTQQAAWQASIKALESGGRYSALGPVTKSGDQAYGAYQIMGNNIGPWSKETLGYSVTPSQFLADPKIQDAIFNKKFGDYVSTFGEKGAAQAWFGGPGSVGKLGRTDMLGTSVGSYSDRFVSSLAKAPVANTATDQLTASLAKATPALTQLGTTATTATSGLGTFGSGLSNIFNNLQSSLLNLQNPAGGGLLGPLFKLFGSTAGQTFYGTGPQYALGGVHIPGFGPAPLKRFAGGGTSSTAAIFGEAGPEAAVPLPDGRSIPVSLKGGGAPATVSVSMPVSINNNTGSQVSVREETDSGGKRLDVQIDESVSSALSRRGSASNRALASRFALNRQTKVR